MSAIGNAHLLLHRRSAVEGSCIGQISYDPDMNTDHFLRAMSMSDKTNPYSPPTLDQPQRSWWSVIWSKIFGGAGRRKCVQPADFARGQAIICCGIAFFVDPYDRSTLYAGSPSTDRTDQRLAIIAREAIRSLPDFLSANREIGSLVEDRRLVVRIVSDYTGFMSDYTRAVEVLPAPLSKAIFPG